LISEDRLQKALTYLANTDESCAELKTETERREFKAKAIRDAIFKRLDGSVADRQAKAGSSDEYGEAMEAYFEAMQQHEAMKNKRATEVILIEVWRSLNASRRAGNV